MRYKRVARGAPIVAPVLLVAISLTAPAQGATSHNAAPANRAVAARTVQRPLTPALAKQLSRNVTSKVIIVLKNQFKALPDTPANSLRRGATVRSAQRGVMSELTATHARNIKSISLVNAIAATVSPGEAKRLRGNPAVAEVTPDLPIPVLPSGPDIKPAKRRAGIPPLPGACPKDKNGVQLDPEALTNIHAASQSDVNTAQGLGYTGKGVKVAWIADGLNPNNPDFIRANGQHVFVDYQDFSGTGTSATTGGDEAFLDASAIAAQGRLVYNIQNYGIGLNRPCLIRIRGVAPGASLVGLNVFGSANFAFNSVFLVAIDYAVSHDHVNVLNESFGSNPFPDSASLDLTNEADAAAVKAGVTVVTSSGDAGVTNTIGTPATNPLVISAGATTTYRSYAQSGAFGLVTLPGVKGWLDNNISGLSSGGFDQHGGTVDVVAPGDLNWALCSPSPQFLSCTNFAGKPSSVELTGGTSQASPLTAGTAALVIQAYREGHHGRSPSPAVVKKIIVSTAQDISAPAEQQGAGIVDAYQAVLAARSYPGAGKSGTKGHALLDSATQLNEVAAVSTPQILTDTITNDGSSTVNVNLSTRTLSPPSPPIASGTLDLTAAGGFGSEFTFTVPSGQARLNASVTVPNSLVELALIAPTGKIAEFNIPQGFGAFGNSQVARPAAGLWTAFVAAIPNSNASSIKAPFEVTTSTFQQFGSVSPSSFKLAPGASQPVTLNVTTPAQPGDEAGAIVVHSTASEPGFAATTTIPVTLRSMAPTPAPTTTFTGNLTGGNGRQPSTGQASYYQFTLPPGENALNASVETGNPNNTLFAVLIDPAGEVVSASQNGILRNTFTGNPVLVQQKGTQLHVLSPVAGTWTLAIDFYNSVSGTAVNQPFTVKLDVNSATASSSLPDSTSTMLAAGTPVTETVTVTNTGDSPQEYFVDAREPTSVNLKLASQTASRLRLPNLAGVVPTYLVPSLTTALSAKVSAPDRNIFDLNWGFGDPDLASTVAKTSTLNFAPASNDIPSGDWTITPFLIGPDGKTGPKPVTATASLTATTNAIDPTVTASTGDLWAGSTNPNAILAPRVVEPGHSATITVTITPKGTAGQVVSGTLYLSTVSFNPSATTFNLLSGTAFPTASTVASFPYTYTIGS